MSSTVQLLQITPRAAELSPEQKRFNRLIGQIAKERATLAVWQQQIPLYQQAHVKRLVPLLAELSQARIAAVRSLDALLDHPGWNRTEVTTLRELVCERAAALIGRNADHDAELKMLFDKHSEVDFETSQRDSTFALKEMMESITGFDLGDDDGIETPDDLYSRLNERQAGQASQAEAEREAAEQRRPAKKTAAQKRREDEAQQATQSVRQVFRQLASVLHPDREPDAAQRVAKTALMQRANDAYAANDLLALLELQLEVEIVDASHIAGASAQRLGHYNKVLAEQLAELKQEVQRVEAHFCMDFGLDVGGAINPLKLGQFVDEGWRELSASLAAHRQEARVLADRVSTRRWLKQMKRRLSDLDADLY